MNRLVRALACAAVAVAAVSCSDSATGPVAGPARGISPLAAAFDNSSGQTLTSDFVLTSSGGTFTILNSRYRVSVPADAVCDPATSTYGPTEWDVPCVTLAQGQQIQVHAVLSTSGGVGVEFSPALRFSPSQVVTIATDVFANTLRQNAAYFLAHPSTLNILPIYAGSNGVWSVDFASDASLITHVDFSTGSVWRRIKHFSGYMQSAGLACTPSPDVPDCVQVDGVMR